MEKLSRRIGFGFIFVIITLFIISIGSALASSQKAFPGKDFFVRWKPGTPDSIRQSYYQTTGMRPVWHSSLVPGLERLAPMAFIESSTRALSMLQNRPEVFYAEPNFHVRRVLEPGPGAISIERFFHTLLPQGPQKPNDPMFEQQWALKPQPGVNIEKAWEVTHGNTNVRVAVIDTGVDSTHPEMKGKLAPGYDFIDKTAQVTDHHGHGTHVAGIIGADTNNAEGIAGINPDVTMVPIRAVPTNGDETDADIIDAFEFAVKAGARVANCSFGKSESAKAVGDTIAAAGEHGLLAIVAAGNESHDLNREPSYPASFQTPNMIVVAATGSRGTMASFSNYGMGKVDVAAPGASILSSIPGNQYASWSGTSMATPQVVGVAALVLSVNPNLTPAQLKAVLLRSAVPNPNLKGRITTGASIDAGNAVQSATAPAMQTFRLGR